MVDRSGNIEVPGMPQSLPRAAEVSRLGTLSFARDGVPQYAGLYKIRFYLFPRL